MKFFTLFEKLSSLPSEVLWGKCERTAREKGTASAEDDDVDDYGAREALREWNFPICKVINKFPNGCLIYVLQNTL